MLRVVVQVMGFGIHPLSASGLIPEIIGENTGSRLAKQHSTGHLVAYAEAMPMRS